MTFDEMFPQHLSPVGCWPSILLEAGVPPHWLAKAAPCPWCGGDDRYNFGDLGVGAFLCRGCKAKGNGYDLLAKWLGPLDFHECSRRVQEILRTLPAEERERARVIAPQRQANGVASQKQLADRHEMWERGVPISADDIVGCYLIGRVGFVPDAPDALRRLPDTCTTWMMARATHPAAWGTLHYTDMNLDAVPRRRSHEGPRPPGSAVRLAPITRGILGVAEGIETALSASVLFNVPVWAALDKWGLENFAVPYDVMALMIFADNDEGGGGLEAAQRLQARCEVSSEVLMPDKVGTDWNDVHRSKRRQHRGGQ
jgi:putative DNA primase/helicase